MLTIPIILHILAFASYINCLPTIQISFKLSLYDHIRKSTQAPSRPPITNTSLTILPLGNSITWGYGSSTGNGYRQPLLSLLTAPKNAPPVDFIGSQKAGNMTNNENEGHPGAIIDQIAAFADASLHLQPNIILLMAGTNDLGGGIDLDNAPERLGRLIDKCVRECPKAVVLVAQLTPMIGELWVERLKRFNAAVPGVVKERVRRGGKVVKVDMEAFVGVEDLMDGLHPKDKGYEGMAKAWLGGIEEAEGEGWIEESGNTEERELRRL